MRFFIKRRNNIKPWLSLAGAVALAISVTFPISARQSAEEGDGQPATLTARKVFENLPAPPLEVLKKTTRLDMLDYWDADSIYEARNVLDGVSSLASVTPDYLRVNITPVSTLEIKLLPISKTDNVVMTLYTVGGKGTARDTSVAFYDTSLRPLDGSRLFTAPELKRFFAIPKGSVVTMKEIEEAIPFATVVYKASAENNDIQARLTAGDYLSVEANELIAPYLQKNVTLTWKGAKGFK